jgi:ABC-type lipoprotein export system ATPase subunit
MLKFNKVSKEFRLDSENTITPVRDVDLDVDKGELIVIIGRSGTGKTTLLNLAAGMVRPTSGQVLIEDKDLAGLDDKELSLLRTRKLGFMFQFPSLIPALNIKDNVSLPAMFANHSGDKAASERAVKLLAMLGLASKTDVYPKQLSAGEQKRVVIARSLINEPKIVLADEPTSDLDSHTEREVMDILRDVNSGGVIFLIVTHNTDLVKFASRAFEMDHGSLNQIK